MTTQVPQLQGVRRRRRRYLPLLSALVSLLLVPLVTLGGAVAASADEYVPVSGAGSTWSQVAIDAWRRDVRSSGIVVNYAGTGSSDGRAQFRYGTVDFGVSEIPFQVHPTDGSQPEISPRPFVYMPIVAGGTSFMYNLIVGGRRVTDLRLSGETITKIFTGAITNWNDPQIKADYGNQLPDKPIVPVVRSDGSGTSAQFSLYMATQYPDIWNSFCSRILGRSPCGMTSNYPQFPGSKAQSGSYGVANYVAASYGVGAITYVEYAYPRQLNFPVVKLLNASGYYVQPTASNVGVALTSATIAPDLTQILTGVYNNPDKRAYPMSSYSYMILPTDITSPMNADKGKTLTTFTNYFLCAGQQKADILGYSPLPINLVQAAFTQTVKVPGAVAAPSNLASCNNPTFRGGVNTLLQSAPYPPACDSRTSAPCGTPASGGGNGDSPNGSPSASPAAGGNNNGGNNGNSAGGNNSGSNGNGSGKGNGNQPGNTNLGSNPSGSRAPSGGPAGPAGVAQPTVDPVTGTTQSGAAGPGTDFGNGGSSGGSGASLAAQVVQVDAARGGASALVLGAIAAAEFLALLIIPPVMITFYRRRRRGML